MSDTLQTIITIIGTFGGLEGIKYFINRKANKRKLNAEASSAEFHVLQEVTEFLQGQIKDKEERFADQTALVRKLNTEVLELTRRSADLELQLQRFKCVVKKCPTRDPQNGY